MLKIDLKKKFENSSKLNQTLSKIENRFLIIKKQNANPLTKAKTYMNVIKAITKMTKNENEKKNIVKKTTTNRMTIKKINHKSKKRSRKFFLKMISNVEFFKRIKRITKDLKNETIKLK